MFFATYISAVKPKMKTVTQVDWQLPYKACGVTPFFKWLHYPNIDDPRRRKGYQQLRENLIVSLALDT